MAESIDDIKPNELVTMTESLVRLFRAAGCDPACHACEKRLLPGDQFKLMPFRESEEMVCGSCTLADLVRGKERQQRRRLLREREIRIFHRPMRLGFSRPRSSDG